LGHAVLAAPEPALQEPVVLRHREHLWLRDRHRPPDLRERAGARRRAGRPRRLLRRDRGRPVTDAAPAPDSADVVVVGAGISGLGFASWYRERRPGARVLVLESAPEPGGYCRTVEQDGFVWDYSGHFFHFKDPAIEAWLRARMPGQEVRTVERRAFIRYAGRDIDFPFQKHIHQLPHDEFLECLVELYFRPTGDDPPRSFGEMLYRRLGRGITDK